MKPKKNIKRVTPVVQTLLKNIVYIIVFLTIFNNDIDNNDWQNSSWPYINYYPYLTLITNSVGSRSQCYFTLWKKIRLKSIIKIPNRRELQQITINHPTNIDFNQFIRVWLFFVNDRALPTDKSLRFRHKFQKVYRK